ncbi:autotransporter outer membrane beta-barrel domain-containing protein [Flavobacterium sangjuense]|uniref:Right handed beta helix domain-containing protein n=1 Tax=Flavobacterium sangjuense TaxID=2518177 RepID=A0A4P7PT62_9FLAO|nr:hypothetical protein [Flavobacterium sangjuense]QBZ97362.1 hypothetical protein GS03_00850 [Flavobacterium sangjuense]
MKKKLLFITLTSLFTSLVSAADLYVRNLGAGGAYSSVSAAITAAANGDRIIIQPKTSGAAYVENLTINKSLTFVSETIYNKYFIQGTITITPAVGRVVTISNLSSGNFTIYGVSVSGATTGGRTTVNLLNSFLNSVDTTQPNTTLNMSGCIVTGSVYFSHGRCTGNKALLINAYAVSPDTNLATEAVEIIGNATDSGITNFQNDYPFKFSNNFVSSINVYRIKTASANEITNNTVYNPNAGDLAPIHIDLANSITTGNITIMNNAVSFVVGQTNTCIYNGGNSTVAATYNVFTNAFVTEGTMTQNNNSGAVNMNFNAAAYTVTGGNVNAGSPAVTYTDLDLTRNDAGHYGGSNSWANYFPSDSGAMPQINYLVTPRAILNTSTLNVTGSGYSK